MTATSHCVKRFLDAQHARQTSFLQSLVQVPSDNPGGDCAPHAEHLSRKLRSLGLPVEVLPVSSEQVHGCGMISATNLIVRHTFGSGSNPTVALNMLDGSGPRTLMKTRGHNTDENLRLNDLYGATHVVALTLADLLAAPSDA